GSRSRPARPPRRRPRTESRARTGAIRSRALREARMHAGASCRSSAKERKPGLARRRGREPERGQAPEDAAAAESPAEESAQRLDPVLDADALAQRTQLGARQDVFELRLTRQADVHEVAAAPFQVRQEPHFLEQLGREILRFVDDEDAGVAAIEPLAQCLLET